MEREKEEKSRYKKNTHQSAFFQMDLLDETGDTAGRSDFAQAAEVLAALEHLGAVGIDSQPAMARITSPFCVLLFVEATN